MRARFISRPASCATSWCCSPTANVSSIGKPTCAPPRKDFEYIFELPASVFEEVAAGQIDLIDAGLKGRIKITGDMRILIRHAELVNEIYDAFAREVETLWPKGKPGSAGAAPGPAGR